MWLPGIIDLMSVHLLNEMRTHYYQIARGIEPMVALGDPVAVIMKA